jgi:hypothetical protein
VGGTISTRTERVGSSLIACASDATTVAAHVRTVWGGRIDLLGE